MTDWDPYLYARFEIERTRVASDLLARVPLTEPRLVYDLGCGPGNSTELIATRFPKAEVIGLDSSPAMLESARVRSSGTTFALADATTWVPERAPDLIYANALLHWLPDHGSLIPRLFRALAPGGVLAVQMPDNANEPSHQVMRAVAARGPWAELMTRSLPSSNDVLRATAYYDLLAPLAVEVDVWRTVYCFSMEGAADVVAWVSSTGLKPFIDSLPNNLRPDFLAAYEAAIDRSYPARADGRRLLDRPRLFIIARKGADPEPN